MNSFGTATHQFPIYDPNRERGHRVQFRREMLPLLDRCNSLYVPSGRWAARGWFLMRRGDYDHISKYSTDLVMQVGNPAAQDNVTSLKNLSIVQAHCVTRGIAADPNALYLVEVCDDRGILRNQWFQRPLTAAYNVRAPAYPGIFFPWSLNPAGGAWTWATMLQDMWSQMGLGAWPGLPSAPLGTPEGFWFTGVPIWDAFCDVLDHLGMTVAADLTSANPYAIVTPGAADAAHAALTAKYAGRLEDDLEWIDLGAGRVPATVEVMFRRRNEFYGSEETVRYDDVLQWESIPKYSVTVAAPGTFSGASGSHYLWSDFTVRYDMDGLPLAADLATANLIAAQRVTEYFARIYRQTLGFMTRTYAGALPFKCGSQVDGICYYQDYRQGRGGWRTKLVRGAEPPFLEVA